MLKFCRLFIMMKAHLISGVERLRAVATRLSSQARLAGSAKPSSTPLPALATPREVGSTWAWVRQTDMSLSTTSSTQTMRALVAAMMCPVEFLVTPPNIAEKSREKPNQGLKKFLQFQKLRLRYLRSSLFTPSTTSSRVAALIAASLNLHISSRLDWAQSVLLFPFGISHSL